MDEFGDRMKTYEWVSDHFLLPRLPVIVRCDGRSFHNVTKRLPRPSLYLSEIMAKTMQHVASKITGCAFAYCQSDEMTFLLKNDQSLTSQPFFDNRIHKLDSIIASTVTYWFNKFYVGEISEAIFDARSYVVPNITEAINVFYWRQLDCVKNSISLVVENQLSRKLGKKTAAKKLHKQNGANRIALLKSECGIDYATAYPKSFQRGFATYKVPDVVNGVTRQRWFINDDLPLFCECPSMIFESYTQQENDDE